MQSPLGNNAFMDIYLNNNTMDSSCFNKEFFFRKETKVVKFSSLFRAINCGFYFSALPVIALVVFVVYVMTGNTLTAERVFVVLGLFMAVRVSFTLFFSLGIMYTKESSVSEKRLQVII